MTKPNGKRARRRGDRAPASDCAGPSYETIATYVARMSDPEKLDAETRLVFGKPCKEVAPHLTEFRRCCTEYRNRYKQDGIPISHHEAVALFKDYPAIDPEYSISFALAELVSWCVTDGQFNGNVRDVAALWQNTETDPWNRYLAQETLDTIARVTEGRTYRQQCMHQGSPAVFEFTFADLMRPFPRVSRPRGRYDCRVNMLRDARICFLIKEAQECGLAVTSGSGDSLAAAMAEVTGLKASAISEIWKNDPTRSDDRTRSDRKLHRHPRCARCGCPAGSPVRRDCNGDHLCHECHQTRN